jgi:hypothetical protein
MFFVLSVDGNGIPQKMVGPVNWERGVELIIEAAKEDNRGFDANYIEQNGQWDLEWGGVYIVSADDDK